MTTTAKMTLTMLAVAVLGARAQTACAEEAPPPNAAEINKLTAGPEPVQDGKSALYHREKNLQETLLATRQRYAAWLAAQPAIRQAVEFGPWLATPPLPADQAEKLVRPAEAIEPDAKLPDGRGLWSPRRT